MSLFNRKNKNEKKIDKDHTEPIVKEIEGFLINNKYAFMLPGDMHMIVNADADTESLVNTVLDVLFKYYHLPIDDDFKPAEPYNDRLYAEYRLKRIGKYNLDAISDNKTPVYFIPTRSTFKDIINRFQDVYKWPIYSAYVDEGAEYNDVAFIYKENT